MPAPLLARLALAALIAGAAVGTIYAHVVSMLAARAAYAEGGR